MSSSSCIMRTHTHSCMRGALFFVAVLLEFLNIAGVKNAFALLRCRLRCMEVVGGTFSQLLDTVLGGSPF